MPLDTGDMPVGIGEFAEILRRRWKIIVATTALVTTLGVAYALIAKPLYTASTSIFVDPRNRASFQIEGTGTGAGYDPNLVDSQSILIESVPVLKRVIEAEKLLDDAEFTRGPGDAASNVLANLKEAIKVKRPERTYVVEIQVRTQDGAKSARIANAIARAYVTDGRDSKSETAQREASWLETHLQNLQGRLKEAESRVEAYKVENRILGVEGKLVGEQQLSELNRGIIEAQRRAAEAKAALDQVETLRKSGRLPDSTGEALRSPSIDRLRGQLTEIARLEANSRSTLGPRHPAAIEIREQLVEVKRLLNEELTRVGEGAKSAYAVAQGNVAQLERQLDGLKREKFLRDKEQIARLNVDTPAGRVITPATAPQYKSFPNRPLIAALAFAGGLFAGVGLALALETLGRARAPSHGPARAPAPVPQRGTSNLFARWRGSEQKPAPEAPPSTFAPEPLAILPAPTAGAGLRWLKAANRPGGRAEAALDAVSRMPNSAYSHAIRQLAGRIDAMVDDTASTTLMVSGSHAETGSPALASNLALALATGGRSVLLVDGTTGRGGLTAAFGAQGPLVEIDMAGQRLLARCLTHSRAGTVYFLPAGGLRPARGERMKRIEEPCSLVLIDGPPLDSAELGRIDIERRIDGVIAMLPAGADPANPMTTAAFDRRFGSALMGVVGQAA
ncbi:MAG: exopolysaccharide polymerization [Beijerinckiaceae bacterium]|nr:MAG: exopolysaccharide polymerization [Beijerinckiaceae bacterium]